MRNTNLIAGLLKWSITIGCGLLLLSCANKGYPEGGPKDETPPEIVKEEPKSFNTTFSHKAINIYFNEFVQLKNINDKFVISPPQAKKPRVRLRGKYVVVEFQDSLRSNTTYSLDFADAIADNNEGNPLGYYRYVFSTGSTIDTLECSGHVVDSETNKPVYNAGIYLYEDHADSIPLKEIPSYMAITDSSGFFRLTNLKDKTYRVMAVKDDSRDFKYAPEVERVAFLDTFVRPQVVELTRVDTLENDSLVTVRYTGYGPGNIYLRMFEERITQLYMVSEEREVPERLRFIFSIPAKNEFKITLLGDSLAPLVREDWYIEEASAERDTLNLWIRDSLVYKRDSLRFAISYLRSDSTHQYTTYHDTTRLVYRNKTKEQAPARRRKKDDAGKVAVEMLEITTNQGNTQDINKGLSFVFNRPVVGDSLKNIRLEEKVDTIYRALDYERNLDAVGIRECRIEYKWKAGAEYRVSIDSGAITDIYGHHNAALSRNFKVNTEEDYGKLMLHLTGVEGQVVVQLYPAGNKVEPGNVRFKAPHQAIVEQDGAIHFTYITPGKYKIRIIRDDNRNGERDTGLYLKKRQPEQIYYLLQEFEIRKNFDVEQSFDLKTGDIGVSEVKKQAGV